MSRAEYASGEVSILGDEVLPWETLDHWVLINGQIDAKIQVDSISIEESGEGISRMRAVSVNPTINIAEGQTCEVAWLGQKVFAGLIRTLTIDTDQSQAVFTYSIEADGWDALLSRRLITATYANQTAGAIMANAITTSGLALDGVTMGTVDDGIEIMLAEADHVRVSDFIRDIGITGGGVAFINPYKQIIFRPTSVDTFGVIITNSLAESIQHMSDIDNYRNRQIVKVTGTGGAIVTETRDDTAQQALRIADEGGSGIYESYEEVSHPTSNVAGELSIMGQTVGYVQLRTYARNARRITVRMRSPAPGIGQLTTLDFPEFGISGTFLAMRKTWASVANQWVFAIEFWESSFQQIALESLLKIVGAGKTAVSISSSIFPDTALFSTPGAFTWTVPAGVTSAQFTVLGAGGGGSESWIFATYSNNASGGRGGNGGKAVTIISVIEGEEYEIYVGIGGSHTTGTAGSGASSTVVFSAVTICDGFGGTGGGAAYLSGGVCHEGPRGTDGGGAGDAISIGGGAPGAIGSDPFTIDATAGVNGSVEVKY